MAQLKFLILENGYTESYHQRAMEVATSILTQYSRQSGWTGEAAQIDMSSDENVQWWNTKAPASLRKIGLPLTIVLDGDIDSRNAKIIVAKNGYLSADQLRSIAVAVIDRNFSERDGTGKRDPWLYSGSDRNGLGLVSPWWLLVGAGVTAYLATENKGLSQIAYGAGSLYLVNRYMTTLN